MSPWYLTVHLFWIPAIAVLFKLVYRGSHSVLAACLSYFLGCLGVIPALVLQAVWNVHVPAGEVATLLELPLWAAPVEEGVKLFAALLAARLLLLDCSRRDFVCLAAGAALGFAAAETLFSVAFNGFDVLPLRVLVSMPAHASFTLFAAIGLAGSARPQVTRRTFWGWWLLSSLAHTSYSAPLLLDRDAALWLPGLIMLAFVALAGVFAAFRLRRVRRRGPYLGACVLG
jgi:RsiW-degrading membrane proteinase PrsW (M82 family)